MPRQKRRQSPSKHRQYLREALAMARTALETGETPVGCVFVHSNKIIGRGMNETNKSRSGIRHAEMCAIDDILEKHSAEIFKTTDLYVTVEPCIMCASALRQLGIRNVYFGCANHRFGGCGSVLQVNHIDDGEVAFQTYPGIYREEAIMLLRDFYMQENQNAPNPKRKAKANREKKLDFDQFDWTKYISEEKLVESIPTVYGCDPRDEEKYRALLEASKAEEGGGRGRRKNTRLTDCAIL